MRFFYQEDLNDCGLACLSTLISHFQHQIVSPYQLKKLLPETSHGGITFFDLLNLANQFGLKGEGYFCEFNLLKDQTQLPILINIRNQDDVSHFVLLTEITQQKIKILDPAFKFGYRNLTWNELNDFYLGQILIFQKIKNWKPVIPWKTIFIYLQKNWIWLFLITFSSIANNYFWFSANFFIHYLEIWMATGKLSSWIFLQFGSYLMIGGFCYIIQLFCLHNLQQSLWSQLLNANLKQFENKSRQNGFFWETLNHQHQALNLLFTVLTKVISNLALLPLIIWTIKHANYLVLVICLCFIVVNAGINNFCLYYRARFQDCEDWEKANYYQQIAHYMTNFKQFKQRQYHQVNKDILQTKQTRYFKIERHNYFLVIITDLNQQLSQRVFSLAFWFLIFFLIMKQSQSTTDLLVLSITTQLWLSMTMDWIHGLLWFKYQKYYLVDLASIQNKEILIKVDLSDEINTLHFKNFGFESPGSFSYLPEMVFKLPFQIQGTRKNLDYFYQAFLINESEIFINNQSLKKYRDELFVIDHDAIPIAATIGENLFLAQSINKEFLEKINLDYWLKKYELQIYQIIEFNSLTKAQLQLINFLSLLFSDYKLYLLNQPLIDLPIDDQQLLWELLFSLKKDNCLIILGSINLKSGVKLDQLNLEDMI